MGLAPDNPAERPSPGRYDAAEIRPPSADAVRGLFDAAFEEDLQLLPWSPQPLATAAR